MNVGDAVRVMPNKAAHVIISVSDSEKLATTACNKSFAYERLRPSNREHLCAACANRARRERPDIPPHFVELCEKLSAAEVEYKALLEARNAAIRKMLDNGVHYAVLCDVAGISSTTLTAIRYGNRKERRREWLSSLGLGKP